MNEAKPLAGVPQVRVLDEEGREVLRGWYVFHEKRQPCVMNDWLKPEDVEHLVAVDSFADWNMPRDLKLMRVSPPHRIEVIDHFADVSKMVDRDALLELADEMEGYCGRHYAEDHRCGRETPPSLIGDYARRIREACEVTE